MRVTIIRDDNRVTLDGRRVQVDCSAMLTNYRAVHWDGTAGYIETRHGDNLHLVDLASFAAIIAQAEAAIAAEDAPPPLSQVRADALAMIDGLAGQARAQFITVTPGQEMTYLEKVRQAQDVAAGGTGDHPLIEGEVGLTGADAAEVAGVILGRYAAWQQVGAAIERTRLTAKRDVAAAADAAGIAVVIAGLNWPVP